MTTVADVISQTMVMIDDIRLAEELRVSPALFYRRLSAYVYPAITLLKNPPELYKYVADGYTAPTYADYSWTSDAASLLAPTNVSTGQTGFDLCSVTVRSEDGTSLQRYDGASYDSTTGIVTFPIQTEVGISYEMDFYSDGSFDTLTPSMMRLMSFAISVIWYERFTNTWLNMQPKINDSSFSTVNEANYMEKMTARMLQQRQTLSDELRKYEQDNAYMRSVYSHVSHTALL